MPSLYLMERARTHHPPTHFVRAYRLSMNGHHGEDGAQKVQLNILMLKT